jgi:acyl carrier protein
MKSLTDVVSFKEVLEIVASQLEVDETKIKISKNFIDELGVDSADMVNVISTIESEFEIAIDDQWTSLMINIENIVIVIELIKKDKIIELLRLLEKAKKV